MHIVYLAHVLPSSSSSVTVTTIPSQLHVLFVFNPLSPLSAASVCMNVEPPTVTYIVSGLESLKETESPSADSHQLPVTSQLRGGLRKHPCLHAGNLSSLISCRSKVRLNS